MTYEEAIKQLSNVTIYHQGKCTREAIDMAVEALKKQMPKMPIEKFQVPYDPLECGLCHSCNEGVNSDMDFCSVCGQALDWGESE